jgi:5-methylcytosine-specific restriction endonuclease McrA
MARFLIPTCLTLALTLASALTAARADTWPRSPDHHLTPGKTVDITLTKICSTSWGTDQRLVSEEMKQQVIAAYHFDVGKCPKSNLQGKLVRRVEIDHLVPRSLGGADDVANLWPECYELSKDDKSKQDNGAHKKDRLEQGLSIKLCKKPTTALLKKYQLAFETDWLALYKNMYGGK